MAFDPGLKIVFIDDADFVSQNAQASLRGIIERFIATCRFILCANDVDRIDAALRSRLMRIPFGHKGDTARLLLKAKQRIKAKLFEAGFSVDERSVDLIVELGFPDFRRIANELEFILLKPRSGQSDAA